MKKHLMFAEASCKYDKGCTACHGTCPRGGLSFDEENKPVINWKVCMECETFECTKLCPNNALKEVGTIHTVESMMRILKRDAAGWGTDGGVTFSGGEPLLHHRFLRELLPECKKSHIHTAIETSAYVSEDIFLDIFKYLDFAFIDVKNMDPEAHKWGTAVDNSLTLSNIRALKNSGWRGRLVLRQPTIGGYNDSVENAQALIAFMKELDLFEINLLKFHRLGASKWQQLGKPYEYMDHGDVSEEKLKELQMLYLENDIACYVGDDTPF